MIGQEKIPILIAEKGQELVKQLVPPIIQIASQTGIQNIGQFNEKLPDSCLISSELDLILKLRNNILDKLNGTAKTIETLGKSTNLLNSVVNSTSNSFNIANKTRIASNLAISLIPPPTPIPGSILSSINILKDLEETLLPKINNNKNIISSISTSLDFINSIFINFINLLKSIDKYLVGCKVNSSNFTQLNDYLKIVESNYNTVQSSKLDNEIYNGFVLEIVEENYTPTVKRIKAVAKNSQGIILLQTPLSFTTEPQILISELKLIIDKDNLKAN